MLVLQCQSIIVPVKIFIIIIIIIIIIKFGSKIRSYFPHSN